MGKSKNAASREDKKTAERNESEVLREMADKLYIWHKSGPGVGQDPQGWHITRLPEEGKAAAEQSLGLLRDYADLLHNCASDYGIKNTECSQALACLDNMLSGLRINRARIENYVGWGNDIALPGFISELRRWAGILEGPPEYLIPIKVAVAEYKASRSTILRDIATGDLISYRSPDASQTSKHILDSRAVFRRYGRRK